METPPSRPIAPGGIGVTRLRVYDGEAPDGHPGGSPHFHLLCTEMYVVIAGHGEVETLSAVGVRRHELSPGRLVWFEAGVVHRLINHGRDLDILVIMQNNGLPEAGDFVLAFPQSVMRDPDEYRQRVSLASTDKVYATGAEAARDRRDLATQGYLEWRAAFEAEGPGALERLYRLGRELVADRLSTWPDIVAAGPDRASFKSYADLRSLLDGEIEHMLNGRTMEADPDPTTRLGMCGHLTIYPL